MSIQQQFVYANNSNDSLSTLYFNDWTHAYTNKNTALAKRFADEFKKSIHLAKDYDRGYTDIISIVSSGYQGLIWERVKGSDIIKIELGRPLASGASTSLFLTYTVKLPPNKFTPYGYNNKNEYYLKDWYLTPAVYNGNGEWNLYSNKNLEDLFTSSTNSTINLTYPGKLYLTSNFYEESNSEFPNGQHAILKATQQKNCDIIITPVKTFTKHITPHLTINTDIEAIRYGEISQGISINRVAKFITENLGEFPHQQLMVSELDYNKDPLYGINQLPSFIRPYDEQFQFEMKFLKTTLTSWLKETMFLDPRKEKWVSDAIINYLMIDYVEAHYPEQKLLGKLSKMWGVKGLHLAKMDFNEQYSFLYMLSARKNWNQALTTPNDSLIKFNQKIANRYKAGLGLAYLSDYIGKGEINNGIKIFYENYQLKEVHPEDFKSILSSSTDKNVDWFFNEYVSTDKRIDFKIKKVFKSKDSIQIVLKNKTGTNVPISLFALKKDSIVSRHWFANITTQKVFTIPRKGADKLVLNYDHKIPEFNQRDNWKTLNGFFSSNKRLKFQFFKDAEAPNFTQVFYVPVASFNIYDGLTPGLRIHNKTLLERPFIYDFSPSYSFGEKSLVGYGKFNYRKYHEKSGLYVSNYSLGGSSFHFQENSRYSKITPAISFGWRPDDLMSNKREFISLRFINVFRSIGGDVGELEEPDYSVLNARYIYSNRGIINHLTWFVDAQQSNDFTKLAFNLEYRKLFENNRQFNVRFFAGKFLRNKTNSNDYFSFALDRPTDYLFDYNYLGRSENSGLYSQQIIIAEGGFKSKLDNPFANDWMTTVNTSFNLWRWIELYGDAGFIKNTGANNRFVYDSGVRLNLVTDYFELYFPLYSSNGWEVAQPNYEEKIRFIVTLSPKTLIGLFTRKWF
ncbi:MAG: metalloprotease [Flavobacteriaceae bacterium]|nr:MAG: metalloprotease [Flavobacteriaceae bacterium]